MMRWLVRIGVAQDWEPEGNYVYRFSRREVHKLSASLGASSYQVSTFFNQYSAFLNERVYPYFNNRLGIAVFKACYFAFNKLLASQGNVFIAVIDKPHGDAR